MYYASYCISLFALLLKTYWFVGLQQFSFDVFINVHQHCPLGIYYPNVVSIVYHVVYHLTLLIKWYWCIDLQQFQFDVLVVLNELCLLGIYHHNVMFCASCTLPVGIQPAYPTYTHCNNSTYKLPGSFRFGTVQDLYKDTRDVIKIDDIMPTLPHIPNFQPVF